MQTPFMIYLNLIILFVVCSAESAPPQVTKKSKLMNQVADAPPSWVRSYNTLQSQFNMAPDAYAIIVDISDQKLYLIQNEKTIRIFPVSSSKYGIGNQQGSNKTPLGVHRISQKFGEGKQIGTIFRYGIDTKRIARIYKDSTDVEDDLVITRILWLEGLEQGINRGGKIDSHNRRIYIHGTQEEGLIGKPSSHGCIRMKNKDVIELFDFVTIGTLVCIQE